MKYFVKYFVKNQLLYKMYLACDQRQPREDQVTVTRKYQLNNFLYPCTRQACNTLHLPRVALSKFSQDIFQLFSVIYFTQLCCIINYFYIISNYTQSFQPVNQGQPGNTFPIVRTLFSELFQVPRVPILSSPRPPRHPRSRTSSNNKRHRPATKLSSPPTKDNKSSTTKETSSDHRGNHCIYHYTVFNRPIITITYRNRAGPKQNEYHFYKYLTKVTNHLKVFKVFKTYQGQENHLTNFPRHKRQDKDVSNIKNHYQHDYYHHFHYYNH